MLAGKLVAEIFRMECPELISDGGALHKVHAAADLERIGDARERLFHEFEGAADDAVYGNRHAPARNLVAEHVDALEAHLLDDHVQELDAVGARFAQSKADTRVYQLERDARKTGAAPHIYHAGGPLTHHPTTTGLVL